jgi:hypothetical protein
MEGKFKPLTNIQGSSMSFMCKEETARSCPVEGCVQQTHNAAGDSKLKDQHGQSTQNV